MTEGKINETTDIITSSNKLREEKIKQIKQHCIDVLVSQTTWCEDEAREKLEENNYNVQSCVRIFMGLPPDRPTNDISSRKTTVNQHIYNNIRGMMDDASRRYEMKKEMEAKIQMARQAQAHQQIKISAQPSQLITEDDIVEPED